MGSENGVEVDSQESYNDIENDHSQKVVALKRAPSFNLKIPVNIVRILKRTEHGS